MEIIPVSNETVLEKRLVSRQKRICIVLSCVAISFLVMSILIWVYWGKDS